MVTFDGVRFNNSQMARTTEDLALSLIDLQRGDEDAFRKLFAEFYTALCLFAKRFVGEGEIAEDIVQEAFLKYWDRHADFDNYYKIKSFLYIVVRHDCLNQIRNNRRSTGTEELALIGTEDFFHYQLMEEETFRILHRAIESLPQQMRHVINFALKGLKNAEIAEKMGISENAVHAYKKAAYKKLKGCLKEYYYWIIILLYFS